MLRILHNVVVGGLFQEHALLRYVPARLFVVSCLKTFVSLARDSMSPTDSCMFLLGHVFFHLAACLHAHKPETCEQSDLFNWLTIKKVRLQSIRKVSVTHEPPYFLKLT